MTVPDDLDARLADIVGDDHVSSSRRALAQQGLELADGDAPAWWLRPGSAAEVARLIQLASELRVAVIPIGNVQRVPRGEALRHRPCFFIDSRRMNHVLHLDETSLVVHVQAGLTAHDLESVLAPRGLSIGDYPPAAINATVGGLLAVRTPGKSSPRHGFLEDAVLGVSAVLADGRTIHTRIAPRRATGPDLARAVVGSEGTLGFITSVVLRIHRRPETRMLDAHLMPSVDTALGAVHLAIREDAAPAAIRVYDAAQAEVHLGRRWCDPHEAILVVATAGPTDLAACDRELVASAANAMGGKRLGPEPAEIWWRQRTGHAQPGEPTPPATDLQVAASPAKQIKCYRAVRAAVEAAGARPRAHVSRFDADGAVMFFGFDPATPELIDTASRAAAGAGAVLLGSHTAEVDPYLTALRAALDPHDIMNPGALRR